MDKIFGNRKRKVRKYTASCMRTSEGDYTLVVSVPVDKPSTQNAHQQGTLSDMLMRHFANNTNTKNTIETLTINDEQLGILQLLTNPDPYWRSSDGRRTKLSKLDDNHLENIISYMFRRLSELDLAGDDRSIEKQCITHIWIYKLTGEQTRRENKSYCNKPELFEDDWLNDYDDDCLFGGLDNHW